MQQKRVIKIIAQIIFSIKVLFFSFVEGNQLKEIFETVKHDDNREEPDVVIVDDRMYDKDGDGKTKNAHCVEVLKPIHNRGFNSQVVVPDA